jgi:2-polyprenyl-3-methyl-5-hydroxy-6-metoxy-1,4-benzoquinol methylase
MSETRAPIEDFEDHVEDVDSYSALARIAMALPPVERAYALARFTILRSKLLTLMSLMLPEEGRILDVGCGFGLFSGYFSLVGRRRRITGVDPNARRVEMADVAVVHVVGEGVAGYATAIDRLVDVIAGRAEG